MIHLYMIRWFIYTYINESSFKSRAGIWYIACDISLVSKLSVMSRILLSQDTYVCIWICRRFIYMNHYSLLAIDVLAFNRLSCSPGVDHLDIAFTMIRNVRARPHLCVRASASVLMHLLCERACACVCSFFFHSCACVLDACVGGCM